MSPHFVLGRWLTSIYPLSLHDALPIYLSAERLVHGALRGGNTRQRVLHRCSEQIETRGVGRHDANADRGAEDRKSTRLNSSHRCISYAVFCSKKKKTRQRLR